MTLLLTAVRDDFVLSVADRRSSVQCGRRFVARDDRFNKHVYFCLQDDTMVCFRGAATFTGVAQWRNAARRSVSTDEIVASALGAAASLHAGFGHALYEVADALARERHHLESQITGPFPGFTIVIAGFISSIREPFVALITDDDRVPDWGEDMSQLEVPAPAPFRIHLAVRRRPTHYIAGFVSAISSDFPRRLDRVLRAPGVRAYDVARLMVEEIRAASRRSESVGSRVSAIVLPANGWVDTGLWQERHEPLRLTMPTTVFPNGTIWDASEVDLGLDTAIGELPRHGLLFESIMDAAMPRRAFRRAKRLRSAAREAPTVFGLQYYVVSGIDPSEVERGVVDGSQP